MRNGPLRFRVKIQSSTSKKKDSEGETVKSWKTVTERYASIEPYDGREYSESNTVKAEISHRIRIRFYSGLVPTMRLLYGKRIFAIETILPDAKSGQEEQVIFARESV